MPAVLLNKYGGFTALQKLVMSFYRKVMASPDISHYFKGMKLSALIAHQTKFVGSLLGGPDAYTDGQLASIHQKLQILPKDFDEMARLLVETMHEHQFEKPDIDFVIEEINLRKAIIIGDANQDTPQKT